MNSDPRWRRSDTALLTRPCPRSRLPSLRADLSNERYTYIRTVDWPERSGPKYCPILATITPEWLGGPNVTL